MENTDLAGVKLWRYDLQIVHALRDKTSYRLGDFPALPAGIEAKVPLGPGESFRIVITPVPVVLEEAVPLTVEVG